MAVSTLRLAREHKGNREVDVNGNHIGTRKPGTQLNLYCIVLIILTNLQQSSAILLIMKEIR
jgi:hypothetical protein